MKTKQFIGTITKKDFSKSMRKASREIELQNQIGWKAVLKLHKSEKTYTRKFKHKKNNN
jgi:hypothetical protein